MALQRTGTYFVMKGFNQFLNGLKRVNREYAKSNKESKRYADSVTKAGERLAVANDKVIKKQKALSLARGNVTRVTKKLLGLQTGQLGSLRDIAEAQLKLQQRLYERKEAEEALTRALRQREQLEDKLSDVTVGGAGVGAGGSAGAIMSTAAALGVLYVAAGAVVGVLRTLWSGFKKLGSAIKNLALAPLRMLSDFMKGALQTAFGVLIRDSIRNTIHQLNRLRDALVTTIAEFQTLEIRIENLVARELRLTGQVDSVAASFEQAVKPAQQLSRWIQDLSMRVPFDVTDIANTTAFAMAMGFTSEEAKSLTLSISNFAAGMGLTSEKMQSIVFNFGQMKAAGKVTGTEMRDLARGAFLPLTDVLDEAAKIMGVATDNIQEFRKQAAAGEVPIEVFFKAFQTVVARDFPEAVERMGKTITGVVQRFKNFLKTMLGIQVFGPLMKRFAADASDALDKLMTPEMLEKAAGIGHALSVAYSQIKAAVQELIAAFRNLGQALGFSGLNMETIVSAIAHVTMALKLGIKAIANFINKIADNSGKQFQKMGQSFGEWGANLIVSLAKGMAAAAKAVVKVLNAIGRIIAGWLKGRSPPKLLPHLDRWGAEAMTEYMKGWLKGDFGVFNDIADKMESFVRSLTKDFIKEIDVVPMILRLRENIAKVMTGKKSLGNIFQGFENATPAIKRYARLIFEVAKANKEVEKAQDDLNRVTEKYEKILDPLNRQLDRLTDRGEEIDDTRRITQLRLILADVNASAGDKERARNEIEALQLKHKIKAIENERDEAVANAEDKLTAAEANLAALEAELEAQEALVDMQIKTNELIKEQIELLERLKEKAGAGGGGLGFEFDPEDFGIPDPEEPEFEFDFDFTEIFYKAQKNIERIFREIGAAFKPLEADLKEFKQIWTDVFEGASTKIGEFQTALDNFFTSPTMENLSITGEKFGDFVAAIEDLALVDMSGPKNPLKAIGEFFKDTIIMRGIFLFNFALGVLRGLLEFITPKLELLGSGLERIATALKESATGEGADGIANFIIGMYQLGAAFGFTGDEATTASDVINEVWAGAMAGVEEQNRYMEEDTKEMGTTVKGHVKDMAENVKSITKTLSKDLVGESIIPDMVADIVSQFEQLNKDIVGEEGLYTKLMADIITKSEETATDMYQKGIDIVQGLWDGIDSLIEQFLTWLEGKFTFLVNLLNLIARTESPSKKMFESGVNLMKGLALGIEKAFALPMTAMTKASSGIIAAGPVAANSTSNTTNNNFTLNMPTTANPASVARAFNVMSVMVG